MPSFDTAFASMKELMKDTLSSSPRMARNYMRHISETQGKFIRAQALLSCAQNSAGDISEDAVKMACSVEIFHLATLVHDDIIDQADIRRGRETLQKKYGPRSAVIVGDYLFSMAMKTVAAIHDREKYLDIDLPDYISRVCMGELEQNQNNGNMNLSTYRYLRIISGKTAALFEAAYYAGGVLGGCPPAELKKYRTLGRYTGMIFQLTDDCMDFEGTEDSARKPVRSDFEHDVITLPVIHAFRLSPELRQKAASGQASGTEIRDAVNQSGGLSHAHSVAERYYEKSMRVMATMDLSEEKTARLTAIAGKALRIR